MNDKAEELILFGRRLKQLKLVLFLMPFPLCPSALLFTFICLGYFARAMPFSDGEGSDKERDWNHGRASFPIR
jgi:hypothetical protein